MSQVGQNRHALVYSSLFGMVVFVFGTFVGILLPSDVDWDKFCNFVIKAGCSLAPVNNGDMMFASRLTLPSDNCGMTSNITCTNNEISQWENASVKEAIDYRVIGLLAGAVTFALSMIIFLIRSCCINSTDIKVDHEQLLSPGAQAAVRTPMAAELEPQAATSLWGRMTQNFFAKSYRPVGETEQANNLELPARGQSSSIMSSPAAGGSRLRTPVAAASVAL